jgi:two-component system probable response regulator PhcQ
VEGLKLLEAHGDDIGVLMTDQRMPGQKGVQLLERARQLRPKVVRMMITAYADFGVTVDAVNLGNIFRYVSKPLQVEDMRNTLRRAMEFFLMQKERDELMREKLSVLQSMVIADRVVSLGVLASGLCQHLRNPLEAVRAFLNLTPGRVREDAVVLDRMRDASFWRDFHSRVLTQAGQIADLIGEIDGSGLAQAISEETDVDVGATVQEVAGELRPGLEANGVDLKATVDPGLPTLKAEPRRLRRMLSLLIESQARSLPQGSHLSVSVRSLPPIDDRGPCLQLLVQDDGPGLPLTAVRSVFDPFSLNHDQPEDLGIRLLAVYFLVHHYGGRVETTFAEGKGTHYRIELPANAGTPVAASTSSSDFIVKVLMNDVLWERLLAGS